MAGRAVQTMEHALARLERRVARVLFGLGMVATVTAAAALPLYLLG